MPRPPRRPRKLEMERLGTVMPQVLADLGIATGGSGGLLALAEAWEDLVGPGLARVCRPVRLRDGVLEVAVDSTVRAQELMLGRVAVLRRMQQRLGADAPADLRVRVG